MPLLKPFDTFSADRIKGSKYKVTQFVLLKLKINGYIENIDVVIIDFNGIDMFLEYNWLVKHDLEVNWKKAQFSL